MLRTSLESPVMKPGGNVKNFADEIILAQSTLVLDNSENLGTSNRMFNFNSRPRNLCIGRFLLIGQIFAFGLFRRLNYSGVIRFVPLIAGILLEYALIRERVLGVRNLFIVHFTLDGCSAEKDEPCKTSDYSILYCVFLLLATIIFLLQVRVGRPRYFPLCPIMNKFMYNVRSASLVKQFLELGHSRCGEHFGVIQCNMEYLGKGMYPLSTLLLRHAETRAHVFLSRIVFEVDQNEEKTVCNRGERTVGLYDVPTLPGEFLALDVMPAEVFIVGVSEICQNFVKKSYADTCECQKCSRIVAYIGVFHTLLTKYLRACVREYNNLRNFNVY